VYFTFVMSVEVMQCECCNKVTECWSHKGTGLFNCTWLLSSALISCTTYRFLEKPMTETGHS
jgi:hypothetical protein